MKIQHKVALLVTGLIASVANAQTASAQEEDIVVTATKRGNVSLQDVPLSVQAVTGDALQVRGAMDIADFYRNIAGLSVQDEGPGDKRYIIRGINASGAGTVGLYLDEIVITGENAQNGGGQAPDIKLFDIERVEVLKGPQGTTFGSSSMAGTVRYVTRKANVDDWGANVQSSLRATDGASLGLQSDASINVPIVPGVFAVRVAGFYADLPGFISNRFHEGANTEKSKAGRVSATLKLGEDVTLTGMAMYQDVFQNSKNYFYLRDFSGNLLNQKGYYQADVAQAPYKDESELYNATLDYRSPIGTFTATASRFVRDTEFNRDASLNAQINFARPYQTTGRSVLTQPKHRRVDSFEARFASDFGGPIEILAGAYMQNENRFFRSQWNTVEGTGLVGPNPTVLLDRTVDTQIREKALFGEVNFAITDALKLTVGGRLFDFKLEERARAIVRAGGAPGAGLGPVLNNKDSGIIGRFNLAYQVSEDVNTYVQVAQGFRSGGTNDQTAAELAGVTIPAGFGSDSLWNYEAGIKTRLFDRMMTLNVAAYYIDWSDIQVRNQASNGQISFPYSGNGGKASVTGFEVEMEARPARGLDITGTVNYSLSKLTENNPIVATGRKGDLLPYVPKWSFSTSTSYETPITSLGVDAFGGVDISYTGASQTQLNSTIANFSRLGDYFLVGARLGVKKAQDWSVTLNATNLFNDSTYINVNEINPSVYPTGYYINRPRTISLGFTKSF